MENQKKKGDGGHEEKKVLSLVQTWISLSTYNIIKNVNIE